VEDSSTPKSGEKSPGKGQEIKKLGNMGQGITIFDPGIGRDQREVKKQKGESGQKIKEVWGNQGMTFGRGDRDKRKFGLHSLSGLSLEGNRGCM